MDHNVYVLQEHILTHFLDVVKYFANNTLLTFQINVGVHKELLMILIINIVEVSNANKNKSGTNRLSNVNYIVVHQ